MKIITEPDERLRVVSEPIEDFGKKFKDLVYGMMRTLRKDSKGIGLSAIQVGVPKRVFIVKDGRRSLVFANPKLTFPEGNVNILQEEGCLSIPGVFHKVGRPKLVEVEAYDVLGRKFHMEADWLLSRIIQHEYDHLEGILFTDHLVDGQQVELERQEGL